MSLWNNLLGRKAIAAPETKRSKAAQLIAMQSMGQAVWSPRDAATLARIGYERNVVVYRCIRMISEAAASVPLLLYKQRREFEDHPLLKLLERPNPRQAGPQFFENVFGHLLISGNAYMEAVTLGDDVRELYSLRPERLKLIAGRDGWAKAYEYSVNGETVRYDQEAGIVPPILHLNLFHPTNDHYGFAPLTAAQTPVDLHNAASNWNKALLDNSARPSGALVYAPSGGQTLTDEQYERLKEELETSYMSATNAGRPLLLEGGLDWKQLSLSPKDMDFIEAKNAAAREIALAFGVPPMLLGIPGDNTYANYVEANRAFWRQAVLPLLGRTARSIAHWLAPVYGDVRLEYDSDAIDALSQDREALWKRVNEASFLSDDEKRAAVGYDDWIRRMQARRGGVKGEDLDEKYNFNENQPRVPAGNPDGGQWADGDYGGEGQQFAENRLRGTISDDAIMLPEVVVTPDKPRKVPENRKPDFEKAVKTIKENAAALKEKQIRDGFPNLFGAGDCGKYVRWALEAAGFKLPSINDGGHGYAKNFGPALEAVGFTPISEVGARSYYPPAGYVPQIGDVVVMDTYPGQKIPAGHIAMFTGYKPRGREEWYSDFDQPRGFWAGPGYYGHKPKYTIYRYQ